MESLKRYVFFLFFILDVKNCILKLELIWFGFYLQGHRKSIVSLLQYMKILDGKWEGKHIIIVVPPSDVELWITDVQPFFLATKKTRPRNYEIFVTSYNENLTKHAADNVWDFLIFDGQISESPLMENFKAHHKLLIADYHRVLIAIFFFFTFFGFASLFG